MTLKETIVAASQPLTQDAYFAESEERDVVTPENLCGLIEYPALFRAMHGNRELRPALSPAMSTGRAMNDFLTCTAAEFAERYTVEPGPVNPKTGKPFGSDTKAYLEWAARLTKSHVTPEDHKMFGDMAQAYANHAFIKSLQGYECLPNIVLKAEIGHVTCLAKIDKLYVSDKAVLAVDVKTTEDLLAFDRTADRLSYREQQALVALILKANGIAQPQVFIAAIEKGAIPRCGVFGVKDLDRWEERLVALLAEYAANLKSGVFATRFEALRAL